MSDGTRPGKTLESILGPDEAAKLRLLWEVTEPAPDEPEYLDLPDWARWAIDGCIDLCHFSILDGCDKGEVDRILITALDAAPEGEEAVRKAAAEMLRSLAAAGDYSDWLDL